MLGTFSSDYRACWGAKSASAIETAIGCDVAYANAATETGFGSDYQATVRTVSWHWSGNVGETKGTDLEYDDWDEREDERLWRCLRGVGDGDLERDDRDE